MIPDNPSVPDDRRYSDTHLWVKPMTGRLRIGLSDYGQATLGEVLAIELPVVGSVVQRGAPFSSIDCVKTAVTLYAPVGGKVLAANTALEDAPGMVNSDPYGDGWIAEVELSGSCGFEDLMDAAAYGAFIRG